MAVRSLFEIVALTLKHTNVVPCHLRGDVTKVWRTEHRSKMSAIRIKFDIATEVDVSHFCYNRPHKVWLAMDQNENVLPIVIDTIWTDLKIEC